MKALLLLTVFLLVGSSTEPLAIGLRRTSLSGLAKPDFKNQLRSSELVWVNGSLGLGLKMELVLDFSILASSLPLLNQRRAIRGTLLSLLPSLFGAPILMVLLFPFVLLQLLPRKSMLIILLLMTPLLSQVAAPRERSRSPKVSKSDIALGQKALAQQLRFPHYEHFSVVDCGGQGDCAYLSIAAGLAHLVGKTPDPVDLVPKGKLQAYLRCQAAKELRTSAADYNLIGRADSIASRVAEAGFWADSVSLLALATAIQAEFRIWTWDRKLSRWQLFVLGSKVGKKKKAKSDKIVWLQLMDHHYQWLRPTSSDFRLDSCVPSSAYIQRLQQFDADSVDPLRGAGDDVAIRSLLGLDSPSPSTPSCFSGRSPDRGTAAAVDPVASPVVPGWTPRDWYKCKCGWLPPPDPRFPNGRSCLKYVADRHWKQCQGVPAPSTNPEYRKKKAIWIFGAGFKTKPELVSSVPEKPRTSSSTKVAKACLKRPSAKS